MRREMKEAITEENYERASQLRDEIRTIEETPLTAPAAPAAPESKRRKEKKQEEKRPEEGGPNK
jgi:hypothetical protein